MSAVRRPPSKECSVLAGTARIGAVLTVAEMRALARRLSVEKFKQQLGPFALIHKAPPPESARAFGLPINLFTTCASRPDSLAGDVMALLFSFEALTVSTLPPLAESEELVVGRQPDCDVVIDEPSASKRHAALRWDRGTGRCIVRDLGSTNGTFVNGTMKVRGEMPLRDGDVVGFGENHYWFLLAETLHARLSSAASPVV